MGGHAAAAGQNALGGDDAVYVVGARSPGDQNDLLAPGSQLIGPVGVEDADARAAPGRGGAGPSPARQLGLRVDAAVQELIDLLRLDAQDRLLLADLALLAPGRRRS